MPSLIDLLCGAGGFTTGFVEAGFNPKLVINHWQTAIDTHAANHPDADHRCADIRNYPMRYLPKADVLLASVICTEISPAGGRQREQERAPGQLELEDVRELGPLPQEAFEQTRATAWCVLRAAEARRFPVVVVENVVEFVTDWKLFPTWLKGMRTIGYEVQIVSVSSAHIGGDDNPRAPQWRDRIYVVLTRKGIRKPDVRPRPLAYCMECRQDVTAVQSWRDSKVRVGKYRQQYDYRCPNRRCGRSIVEPYVRPASDIVMWDDIGTRIGDRTRPLAASSIARIRAGLLKFPRQPSVLTMTHGKTGGDRAFDPGTRPMPTRTAKQGEALLVPVGGSWNTDATSVEMPLRTRTTRESEALITIEPFVVEYRNHATASPVSNPLSTITAQGNHHALVVPNGTLPPPQPHTLVIPVYASARTESRRTRAGAALFGGDELSDIPAVEDCYLRMFQPREQLSGQRFPGDYKVCGNKAEQTMQAGNAVSVNVARWLGERVKAVLA